MLGPMDMTPACRLILGPRDEGDLVDGAISMKAIHIHGINVKKTWILQMHSRLGLT